jgi:hypothetical protein
MKETEKLKEEFKDNPELLKAVYAMEKYLKAADDITCEYCGVRSGDFPNLKFHIDHIFPRLWGGTNDPENLADACMPCNLRKKDQRGWKTLSGRTGKSIFLKLVDGEWIFDSKEFRNYDEDTWV